jgi:PiT family inorganic phosphate transporter
MYLVREASPWMERSGQVEMTVAEGAALRDYKGDLDHATRFIPTWVKVAVAIALGGDEWPEADRGDRGREDW